ncbi:MAG: tRNA (adenosine(37)-N6)-threonylcarbamoyltransferase complex ATPase subunit type 1 TsaE [Candidatus Omnitrophica bacterium]|nr:tRNA (adenosine(37)-N6)-threonylcarbamoyltransferase complex ATPase subunit type 1 TsaE [Candidatus Omnitrophota bacterium]
MGNPQSPPHRKADPPSVLADTIRNPKSEGGLELISGSVEETQAIGERIGRLLRPGDVVAFFGELGTGKTTLIQGIAKGLGRDPEAVKSPTFVLMREYPPGPPCTKAARPGDHYGRSGGVGPGAPITTAGAGGEAPLIHIDGYRLADARAVSWLDLDLMFSPRKITVIEWAERFTGALPEQHIEVRLSHVSANRRRLSFVPSGDRATEVVAQLQSAISATLGGGRNPHSAISATKVDDAPARD